ncbi:hypothetical protein NHQ30_006165 [Ciborinia camelliae]|nr:hypothetical protein NHQ30_006165 [Ciborinia camelliae]
MCRTKHRVFKECGHEQTEVMTCPRGKPAEGSTPAKFCPLHWTAVQEKEGVCETCSETPYWTWKKWVKEKQNGVADSIASTAESLASGVKKMCGVEPKEEKLWGGT